MHRASLRFVALVSLALAGLSACNAIVHFDPEGQPCNPQATTESEECVAGFVCQDGKCKHSASDAPDAGP